MHVSALVQTSEVVVTVRVTVVVTVFVGLISKRQCKSFAWGTGEDVKAIILMKVYIEVIVIGDVHCLTKFMSACILWRLPIIN